MMQMATDNQLKVQYMTSLQPVLRVTHNLNPYTPTYRSWNCFLKSKDIPSSSSIIARAGSTSAKTRTKSETLTINIKRSKRRKALEHVYYELKAQ